MEPERLLKENESRNTGTVAFYHWGTFKHKKLPKFLRIPYCLIGKCTRAVREPKKNGIFTPARILIRSLDLPFSAAKKSIRFMEQSGAMHTCMNLFFARPFGVE